MNRGGVAGAAAGIAVVFALAAALLGFAGVAVLGGALPGGGCAGDGGIGGGSQQVGPRSWSGEQTANAQIIVDAAVQARLPRRAAVIAVSTAIVESGLRNLTYGDRDSVGLFQQRPSQGWGTVAQILTPTLAAAAFYEHLLALPGWATLPAGAAAQAVQRSANPGAYAPQEPVAADLVARFWTGPDNPAPPPTTARDAAAAVGPAALLGCPDQGGSNLALGPSRIDPRRLPTGFTLPSDPHQRAAVGFALAQLGKPYVWGAEGPGSFDCSGLMQAAYAAAGVAITRTTATQVHDGIPVAELGQLTPGDLLFIPGALGTAVHPGHVGMYAGGGIIVDAYDTNKGVILETVTAWRTQVVAIRHITGPSTTAAGAAA
jgi:cell wall-associated NlpC family hydrolase